MVGISIGNLGKSYGNVEVIKDLNLEIENGQFTVLVGPSGCGKSTLLRMLAGLESTTNGTINFDEQTVNSLPPSQRDIAMVFQNYALYPHKTVAENMGFALKMRKMDKTEINTRVNDAAQILGLSPYLTRYPRALSGGQRQRVAMGRAIVRDPKVFLFDEPLSNLDAKLRVQMRTEIRELHQRLQTTTVYVTHDQIEAMTMADKIVIMRGGHIEQTGSPLELYDFPTNTFVASFIGSPSMNLLRGTIKNSKVVVHGTTFDIPKLAKTKEGQAVIFGVRPESLTQDKKGMQGKVRAIEPTGAESHIIATIDDEEVTAITTGRSSLKIGSKIRLSPTSTGTHLFDAQTGNRI